MKSELDDETLVAYLDGELSAEEVSTIDQQLDLDEALRRRVNQLRASWALLEDLPDSEPSPKLAQTTIELITLSLAEEQDRSFKQWFVRHQWIALTLGALAMLACGAVVSTVISRNRTKRLLEDLPILVYYPELKHIDSLEWLQQLAEADQLFEAAGPARKPSSLPPLPNSISERRTWLSGLDDYQLAGLKEANVALQSMDDPVRLHELRRVAAILSLPSSTDYPSILNAYSELLNRIGTTELTHLNAIDDRTERGKEFQRIINRELAVNYAQNLESDDQDAIDDWIYKIKDRYSGIIFRSSDPDNEIVQALAAPSFITPEDLDELEGVLSSKAQDLLQAVEPALKRNILELWILNVLLPMQDDALALSAEELKERFEALASEKRLELEFLPEREFKKRLSQ